MEDRYIYRGQHKLRCGYTTGSCAAAAAAGAARMLLEGKALSEVLLVLPKGERLCLSLEDICLGDGFCSCAVRKDSGDDPDVTDGMLVYAKVCLRTDGEVVLTGGKGIGRVTKPGLSIKPGEAAINPVPRRMILESVQEVCRACGYAGGLSVEISAPEGEQLAKRTFNPKLGIEGGLSILGTTGIVEPMSEDALIRTIELELRMAVTGGNGYVLLVPGNYGETFVREARLAEGISPVKCSNYVGESLDAAVRCGAKGVLYVAHIGKFVKIAEGMFNTHSAYGDARMAILCAAAVRCGAAEPVLSQIVESVTTDEALRHIREAGLLEPVMEALGRRIEEQLARRVGGSCMTGAIVFSNEYGKLLETPRAEELLLRIRENTQKEVQGKDDR